MYHLMLVVCFNCTIVLHAKIENITVRLRMYASIKRPLILRFQGDPYS